MTMERMGTGIEFGRSSRTADRDLLDEAETHRRRKPGISLTCGRQVDVSHVGVVFVHGIGSQQAGETLEDWGGKLVSLLADARLVNGFTGDPVVGCDLDPDDSGARYVEVDVPRVEADVPFLEQHWVLTEAWWAQRIRPPSFGQMAEWLGPHGAIRRILLSMIPREAGRDDPRARPFAAPKRLTQQAEDRPQWPAYRRALQAVWRSSVSLYLQALSALVLVLYGLLRSIESLLPIGPLKDGALTRPLDSFVLDWFGDMFVLLGDPAQAESVRNRLADAVDDLRAAGCERVVVVAHSGGAVVSYMTLGDDGVPADVSELVTLGEGLNLAWLLTGSDDAKPDEPAEAATKRRYPHLYADVPRRYPALEWHDFWASQDPAPLGELHVRLVADQAELGGVVSHGVWNRISVLEDHGGYWDNDEEFLIPLFRLIESPQGASRFFGERGTDASRSMRRRRRLSILSVWRQLCLSAALAGVVAAFVWHPESIFGLADSVAHAWAAIPGSDVVTRPLNAVRALDATSLPPVEWLAQLGVWIVAVVIASATIFSVSPPPGRDAPWSLATAWYQSIAVRMVPWVIGLPIAGIVGIAASRFLGTLAPDALQVGVLGLIGFGLVFGLVSLPSELIARGAAPFEILQAVLVMAGVVLLVVAPVVSAVVFVDVGRTVLAAATVVVAFQVLARLGSWRWSVWDERERTDARVGKSHAGLGRVAVQVGLLLATAALSYLAVVLASSQLFLFALAGVTLTVFVGIAVDVFDAIHVDDERVTDAFLRYRRAARVR